MQFVSNCVLIAEMISMNSGSAKDPFQQTGSYDNNTNFSIPNIGLLQFRIVQKLVQLKSTVVSFLHNSFLCW